MTTKNNVITELKSHCLQQNGLKCSAELGTKLLKFTCPQGRSYLSFSTDKRNTSPARKLTYTYMPRSNRRMHQNPKPTGRKQSQTHEEKEEHKKDKCISFEWPWKIILIVPFPQNGHSVPVLDMAKQHKPNTLNPNLASGSTEGFMGTQLFRL